MPFLSLRQRVGWKSRVRRRTRGKEEKKEKKKRKLIDVFFLTPLFPFSFFLFSLSLSPPSLFLLFLSPTLDNLFSHITLESCKASSFFSIAWVTVLFWEVTWFTPLTCLPPLRSSGHHFSASFKL